MAEGSHFAARKLSWLTSFVAPASRLWLLTCRPLCRFMLSIVPEKLVIAWKNSLPRLLLLPSKRDNLGPESSIHATLLTTPASPLPLPLLPFFLHPLFLHRVEIRQSHLLRRRGTGRPGWWGLWLWGPGENGIRESHSCTQYSPV
nr:uncharacterized protein LOC113711951 [Coffea arabica]